MKNLPTAPERILKPSVKSKPLAVKNFCLAFSPDTTITLFCMWHGLSVIKEREDNDTYTQKFELKDILACGMETPVQKVVTLAEEAVDLKKREARRIFGFVCSNLLQGRSKEENQEKRDSSDSKLGGEPRGEKGSGCRVQAYAIGHDKDRRRNVD